MENPAVLIALATLGLTAITAFVVYRVQQKKRVRRVEGWVREYLCVRYGELPNLLSIDCSDDPLWPVLVAFDTPRTGIRHNMRFTSGGTHATFALLSEEARS